MEVFEPCDPQLRKYIHSIYFINENESRVNYIAFPATFTPVALFRNAEIKFDSDGLLIKTARKESYSGIIVSLLAGPAKICYEGMPDEIAVNFSPGCLVNFIPDAFVNDEPNRFFHDWDGHIKGLFSKAFAETGANRLRAVEEFLLARFNKIEQFEVLDKAVQILSDPGEACSVMDVSQMLGVPYKIFYRNFVKYIGCSPVHFRKITRFRSSINEKIKNNNGARLVDISYSNNYTDQSYFIKEYQKYTGENPRNFFKHITALGNDQKIIWKYL